MKAQRGLPRLCLRTHVRCLRTGYTHWFSPRDGIDRAAPAAFRERCRSGDFQGQTSGCVPGFVQANFVALPREHAFDFLRFTLENPRACPLLDVTAPGDPRPLTVAPKADLRTDRMSTAEAQPFMPRVIHSLTCDVDSHGCRRSA